MTSRRGFIQQMAWVAAGSFFINDALALGGVKDKKIGVQLYTVRDDMAKDPKGTLKQIAAMGFGEVEHFGYNGKFFGMEASEYKKVLDECGLVAPSGHYLYGNFGNKQNPGTVLFGWEKAVADAKAIGQTYMAIAFLMPEERTSIADYKKIAADLNKAGAICKKAGIQLCYHNHDFEFQELEGQIPFDILANETDPGLVKFELDLFWVSKAGKDPIALFKQYKGRVALWHVKDMDNTPNKNFTEVGSGVIDYARIFKHAKTAGMKHFFVEQDVCPGAPLNSIRKSIAYVQSTLLKNL